MVQSARYGLFIALLCCGVATSLASVMGADATRCNKFCGEGQRWCLFTRICDCLRTGHQTTIGLRYYIS
ncbi:hypothetical protein PR002_g17609 [Phytophthora rubi]|nr:hypothetical protein PF003_g32240 [Phytophthora fragariae]KAE9002528.1 hypothetical protein PR002_g17609 [Phytophthora rubi]